MSEVFLPPVRQQAHDLVERLSPMQLSALIDLLGVVAAVATRPSQYVAPFSDEPLDGPEQRDRSLRSLDSDFWPVAGHP
jgi:hypothetical protein